MNQNRAAKDNEATRFFGHACRALDALRQDETGVTAIEYALLAALIVIVASASIALLGGGVGGMWTNIAAQAGNAL